MYLCKIGLRYWFGTSAYRHHLHFWYFWRRYWFLQVYIKYGCEYFTFLGLRKIAHIFLSCSITLFWIIAVWTYPCPLFDTVYFLIWEWAEIGLPTFRLTPIFKIRSYHSYNVNKLKSFHASICHHGNNQEYLFTNTFGVQPYSKKGAPILSKVAYYFEAFLPLLADMN